MQTPASRLKKQFPHPCQPCRHSREGGNPDLRLSEIFNDHRSVDFAYGYGLRQYRLRRVSYIFSRAKPTLRQPIADPRKSSEKTHSTSLPASPSFPRRRESDLRFSEIFNDYCSVGCVHGYGLRQYQLRRVSYISRGRSPRYGSHFQIPSSRLKKLPISLPASPSFPRRRESRPLIFRNIQRLPQYGLCPQMRFAEILVSAGRLCFTGETLHIFRRRF